MAYVVLIEGGPVTRVEALEMPSIIAEVTQDLSKIGVTNPDIQVLSFKSVTDFESMVPKLLVQIHGVLVSAGTQAFCAINSVCGMNELLPTNARRFGDGW